MEFFRDSSGQTAYTVDHVAEMFGVTRHALDWYIRHGYLKEYGNRLRRRITAESLYWWRWWQENEWPQDRKPDGYIYLVHSYHRYKIGKSINVEQRIKALKTSSATPITLIHTIPTDNMVRAEQFLHSLYTPKREHGEWFKLGSLRHVEIICNCRAMYFAGK